GNDSVADAYRDRPPGSQAVAPRRLCAKEARIVAYVDNPAGGAQCPYQSRQPLPAEKRTRRALPEKFLVRAPRHGPAAVEADLLLHLVDYPQGGHVVSQVGAQHGQQAEQGLFLRDRLPHDLAHLELHPKAAFSAVLLGYVPKDAADRDSAALITAAA